MPETDVLPPGGYRVADPVWRPWAPAEVQARLRDVTAPWYVAAGWALDLFRGEQTRNHLAYDEIIRRDPRGIPYLAPQFVLLFKAKANRPKDQADFEGVLPLLAPDDRSWLAAALQRIHPGHVWLDRL